MAICNHFIILPQTYGNWTLPALIALARLYRRYFYYSVLLPLVRVCFWQRWTCIDWNEKITLKILPFSLLRAYVTAFALVLTQIFIPSYVRVLNQIVENLSLVSLPFSRTPYIFFVVHRLKNGWNRVVGNCTNNVFKNTYVKHGWETKEHVWDDASPLSSEFVPVCEVGQCRLFAFHRFRLAWKQRKPRVQQFSFPRYPVTMCDLHTRGIPQQGAFLCGHPRAFAVCPAFFMPHRLQPYDDADLVRVPTNRPDLFLVQTVRWSWEGLVVVRLANFQKPQLIRCGVLVACGTLVVLQISFQKRPQVTQN